MSPERRAARGWLSVWADSWPSNKEMLVDNPFLQTAKTALSLDLSAVRGFARRVRKTLHYYLRRRVPYLDFKESCRGSTLCASSGPCMCGRSTGPRRVRSRRTRRRNITPMALYVARQPGVGEVALNSGMRHALRV